MMFANSLQVFIDGGKNATTRRCELKEYLGAKGKEIIRETGQACDCLWETLQIPKKSRFSSGNRLWQSINSEGVRQMDANRLKNKSRILEEWVLSTFQ
jgi:hypothetical protein